MTLAEISIRPGITKKISLTGGIIRVRNNGSIRTRFRFSTGFGNKKFIVTGFLQVVTFRGEQTERVVNAPPRATYSGVDEIFIDFFSDEAIPDDEFRVLITSYT